MSHKRKTTTSSIPTNNNHNNNNNNSTKPPLVYPPTEGETEDTEVIVEPTTATQKRARTTTTTTITTTTNDSGGNNNLEDDFVTAAAAAATTFDGNIIDTSTKTTAVNDTDMVVDDTTAVPTLTTTTTASSSTLSKKKNSTTTTNDGDDDDDDDDEVAPASYSSTTNTVRIPSHLNPTNSEHFDHFLYYLLVVRAQSCNPNLTITKEEYPILYAWIQHLKREYKTYVTINNSSNTTNKNTEVIATSSIETPNSTTTTTAGTTTTTTTTAAATNNSVQVQPQCYITAQQIMVLESLHVPLTSRGDDHWNRYYELLIQYKKKHGHVLVPRLCEVPGLGDWVTDQRRQYKAKQQGQPSQMTHVRQDMLDELHFVWHVRNRPEWEVRFSELLEYKEAHGDCRVPQHYKPNKSLGKWVAKQREQYKLKLKGQHSFLTPYREERLNHIGFSWHVRNSLDNEVQGIVDHMHTPTTSTTTVVKTEENEPITTATDTALHTNGDDVTVKEEDITEDNVIVTTTTATSINVDKITKEPEENDAEGVGDDKGLATQLDATTTTTISEKLMEV